MLGIYTYGCPAIFPTEVGIFVLESFSESANLNINDSFFWEIFRRVKLF